MRGKLLVAIVLILVLTAFQLVLTAHAATVTTVSDTLSTIKQSVLANHTIQFVTPSGIASTGLTLTITFPTGFSIGTFNILNEDMNEFTGTPGSCSGATTAKTLLTTNAAAAWGVSSSGQVFTFTSPSSGAGSITAGNCVQIIIGAGATTGGGGTNIITNQTAAQNAAAGGQTISIGGTMIDSGSTAVNIVTDNTVAVTAAVVSEIACSLDINSVAFGTFSLDTIKTGDTTPTWTISTNNSNGYSLAVADSGNGAGQAGLFSSGAGYTINSNTADLASAVQGYGLQATKTNGDAGSATTTVQSPFTATGTNVGGLVTSLIPASGTTVATANGPVSHATVVSTLKAKLNGVVPAGSYLDTLTYVCTGIF